MVERRLVQPITNPIGLSGQVMRNGSEENFDGVLWNLA
jgi:hypothetical protein